MTARRGLTEGETFESDSAQTIFRPVVRASRAMVVDDGRTSATTRAARGLPLDDTTTIRPGLRALASPVETTVIRIKHTAHEGRRLGWAILLAPVVALGAFIGFAFFMPDSNPPIPAPFAVAAAQTVAVPSDALSGDAVDATDLTPALSGAADALSTDHAVKAAAAAKALADQQAASQAAAEKQAAADARVSLSTSRADYSAADQAGPAVSVSNGAFVWPVTGYAMTSTFGWRISPITHVREFHTGNDLAIACGTPIIASSAGQVTVAGWVGGLGNYVEINHGALSTGYGHMSRIAAKIGQQVKQGDVIGYVGSTGNSTGCHVHFQAIDAQGLFFDSRTLIH